MTLKRLLLAVSMCCLIATANAAPIDDAIAAYNNGDYSQALRIWKPLAEQGNADAQNSVGGMYVKGEGLTQSNQEALRWYRLSAEQGNHWAQYNIGTMYGKGQGVTQNYQEALKWLRLSAVQGNAEAQYTVGAIYANGLGVTQNYQEALKWYRLAAAQGNVEAIENLKLPDMISAAQQYPQTYQPQQTYQPTPQPKSESNKTDMTSAMSKCSDLGFKKGTEKHGDCVLKLSR